MLVELHARSDVGRVRRGNEDNFLLLDLTTPRTWSGSDGPVGPQEMNQFPLGEQGLVLVVSDGMGGALAGDVASRMAIEAVHDVLMGKQVDGAGCAPGAPLVDCLKEATMQANRNIHYKSLEDSRCSGMGATLTGAIFGAAFAPPFKCCCSCIWMKWLTVKMASVTQTGVAAVAPTSNTVKQMIPTAKSPRSVWK